MSLLIKALKQAERKHAEALAEAAGDTADALAVIDAERERPEPAKRVSDYPPLELAIEDDEASDPRPLATESTPVVARDDGRSLPGTTLSLEIEGRSGPEIADDASRVPVEPESLAVEGVAVGAALDHGSVTNSSVESISIPDPDAQAKPPAASVPSVESRSPVRPDDAAHDERRSRDGAADRAAARPDGLPAPDEAPKPSPDAAAAASASARIWGEGAVSRDRANAAGARRRKIRLGALLALALLLPGAWLAMQAFDAPQRPAMPASPAVGQPIVPLTPGEPLAKAPASDPGIAPAKPASAPDAATPTSATSTSATPSAAAPASADGSPPGTAPTARKSPPGSGARSNAKVSPAPASRAASDAAAKPSAAPAPKPTSGQARTAGATSRTSAGAVAQSLPRASIARAPVRAVTVRNDGPPSPAAPARPQASPPSPGKALRIERSSQRRERAILAVGSGYEALRAGDLDVAAGHYRAALEVDGNNPDAWVGLAAIAASKGQGSVAQARYRRALEIDPSNPAAHAGLQALEGRRDPSGDESRLRSMLAANPADASLLNALGNSLADQGRWPEAQQAYFAALGAAPERADYAFNLAVSLERIRQPATALRFYRRAIELAVAGHSAFDPGVAHKRVEALSRPPAPRSAADSETRFKSEF
ncbi:MAG: tetratricopeptide repeat protein [Burkholderiaceae bacterium]|nr:tetratricopeptide repeat protein [Burkholderiaceae bacterium]